MWRRIDLDGVKQFSQLKMLASHRFNTRTSLLSASECPLLRSITPTHRLSVHLYGFSVLANRIQTPRRCWVRIDFCGI